MVQREQLNQFSFFLFFAGLLLLAFSLPLSKFTMSIAQFMIAGSWVINGDFANKFKRFTSSRVALAIVAIYLIHVAGLIHTADFDYALKDLRIKLPLLILPLILVSSPRLSELQFEKVLLAVVAGVVISTFISFLVYAGVIERTINDIRDISIFISHIRLSLLCCVSVFICVWLVYRYRDQPDQRNRNLMLLIPVVIWLIYFLFLVQSVTGVVILATVFSGTIFYLLFSSQNIKVKVIMILVLISLTTFAWVRISAIYDSFKIKENVADADTSRLTLSGRTYDDFSAKPEYENGYPMWLYINEFELIREWEARSPIDYWEKDKRGQDIRFTIIRYLTSKGQTKDSAGLWSLTDNEITAIENGIANVNYLKSGGLDSRIHQIFWEINNLKTGGDPSGHSAAQRFVFWKAACGIISKYPAFGVGTGDPPGQFEIIYDEMDTVLTDKWRLRSHNQYLSIAVAFGITGLVFFLLILVYLISAGVKNRDFLYLSFAAAALISMITEDTLETQAGVTFFTLFTCLFLLVNPRNYVVGGKQL